MTTRQAEHLLADRMANEFTRTHPEFAARLGFARWQKAAGIVVITALVLGIAVNAEAVAILLTVLATALTGIDVAITARGLRHRQRLDPAVADEELPPYTVIVPAYQEEKVIGATVQALAALDYPHDRLEVLVLVEQHDPATKAAVLAVDPPPFARVVDIPAGPPQTKPRTCNLGLLLARGELVVVFDAEDRPEPDQLRKTAARFARDTDLACVQARLSFYNADDNVLTRLFEMEYATRYRLLLPGLSALRMPIPLGGTSNHFRTNVLREAGGWDAWNVTEDADLGMRCAAMGYRVDVVDSTTWEEAVARPWPWVRQRTRWFKGWYLTALVHTRRPLRTWRRFGPRGMVPLLALVGGTPVSLLALSAATVLGLSGVELPAPLVLGSLVVLAASTVLRMCAGAGVIVLATPLYGLLCCVAAWRALWELVRAPFVWDKTSHGD